MSFTPTGSARQEVQPFTQMKRDLAMESMSFAAQATNPTAPLPAQSPATSTLIYRGVTYEVPQQRVNRKQQAQERLAQLVGQRLIYRGSTYEIEPAAPPAPVVATTMHRLIYRGTTYLKAV
jgi:TRAP-type uncharacterized transport system substrate-binding protein